MLAIKVKIPVSLRSPFVGRNRYRCSLKVFGLNLCLLMLIYVYSFRRYCRNIGLR